MHEGCIRGVLVKGRAARYRPRVVVIEFNRNFELRCFATFSDPTGRARRGGNLLPL